MRKSTLITTIAMIVVVVVALSTATFAWFTSSTATTATQTITTSAASGLTLSTGEAASPETGGLITWSPAIQDITIDGLKGLYSPVRTGAIPLHITNANDGNAQLSAGYEKFISAEQLTATTGKVIINGATTDASGLAASAATKPILLRLVNGTENNVSNACLTILIDLGPAASATNAQKLGAAATTFYLNVQSSDTAGGTPITLGYTTSTVARTGSTADDYVSIATKADTIDRTATGIEGTRPDYNNIGATGIFKTITEAEATNSDGAVAKDNLVLQYKVSLGSLPQNAGINMVLYSWVDGWIANDLSRGNYEMSVKYIFGAKFALDAAQSQT